MAESDKPSGVLKKPPKPISPIKPEQSPSMEIRGKKKSLSPRTPKSSPRQATSSYEEESPAKSTPPSKLQLFEVARKVLQEGAKPYLSESDTSSSSPALSEHESRTAESESQILSHASVLSISSSVAATVATGDLEMFKSSSSSPPPAAKPETLELFESIPSKATLTSSLDPLQESEIRPGSPTSESFWYNKKNYRGPWCIAAKGMLVQLSGRPVFPGVDEISELIKQNKAFRITKCKLLTDEKPPEVSYRYV